MENKQNDKVMRIFEELGFMDDVVTHNNTDDNSDINDNQNDTD